MNHSERIADVARQSRHLTQRLVKEAVDRYLQQLAEEIANGEWVEIPGIGRLQVRVEAGAGILNALRKDGTRTPRRVQQHLRSRIHLSADFKRKCYRNQERSES